MSGNFPKPGSFLSGFPGISGKLGEKISRNSPDDTFSPWFTERFPENARKSRGKFRGEIFPSGSFPDFPKFARREIFSTNFTTTLLTTCTCIMDCSREIKLLQSLWQDTFVGNFCRETFAGKTVPAFSPAILGKLSPEKSFLTFCENTGDTPWEKRSVYVTRWIRPPHV